LKTLPYPPWPIQLHSRRANRRVVLALLLAQRRVQDQVDLAVLDAVDDVRAAFVHFVDALDRDAGGLEHAPGAFGGEQLVTQARQFARFGHDRALVDVLD
jgi:hypothetical protein